MLSVMKTSPMVKEIVMLLPNLAMLIGKLAADKRVPTETKITLGAAALYLVSPIDVLPDVVPFLGQFDDVLMAVLIVDGILNHIEPEILREHWNGDPRLLEKVSGYSRTISSLIPEFIRKSFFDRAFRTPLGKGLTAFSQRMEKPAETANV